MKKSQNVPKIYFITSFIATIVFIPLFLLMLSGLVISSNGFFSTLLSKVIKILVTIVFLSSGIALLPVGVYLKKEYKDNHDQIPFIKRGLGYNIVNIVIVALVLSSILSASLD